MSEPKEGVIDVTKYVRVGLSLAWKCTICLKNVNGPHSCGDSDGSHSESR